MGGGGMMGRGGPPQPGTFFQGKKEPTFLTAISVLSIFLLYFVGGIALYHGGGSRTMVPQILRVPVLGVAAHAVPVGFGIQQYIRRRSQASVP